LVRKLRAENKGTLFAYSVEADEGEATGVASTTRKPSHKHAVQEMIRAIDVAADFEDSQIRADEISGSGRRTWVAVKLVSQQVINIPSDVQDHDAIGSDT
jgi:proline dehydrogenase